MNKALPLPYLGMDYSEVTFVNEHRSTPEHSKVILDHIEEFINMNEENARILQWMKNHSDKLVYISDFSCLVFGLVVDEEYEKFRTMQPCFTERVYPNYDITSFITMTVLQRLEWMNENCDFIPWRIMYEDMDLDVSHKYSHIKRAPLTFNLIKNYLESVTFPPSDNVYYFIRLNEKTMTHYLKRDLKKSPRKGVDNNGNSKTNNKFNKSESDQENSSK